MDIQVINFAKAELPSIKQTKKGYVSFGDNNKFPEEVVALYNSASLLSAIIESKNQMTFGNGFILTFKDDIDDISKKYINAKINNLSSYCTTQDLIEKIVADYNLSGQYFLEIIWNDNHTKIVQINHLPQEKCRVGKVVMNHPMSILYNDNGFNQYSNKGSVELDVFNSDVKSNNHQIYHFKNNRVGSYYYGIPDWYSAFNYVKCEVELAQYYLSVIQNGMQPSLAITLKNGNLDPEKKKKIADSLVQEYTGSSNAGKILVMFADNADTVPQIDVIEASNLDKMYIELNNTIIQNILSANRITNPMIMGIKSDGISFSGEELMNSYKIYQKSVIEPIQNKLEFSINTLLKYIDERVSIEFVDQTIIEFSYSESLLKEILTQDELREKIGYAALNANTIENKNNNTNNE